MTTAAAGRDVCVASGGAKRQISAWGARKTLGVGVCYERAEETRSDGNKLLLI